MVKARLPSASVVDEPVPTLHLPAAIAPEIAKPVAAVPVTVSNDDVEVPGGVEVSLSMPRAQAASAVMDNNTTANAKTFDRIESS